MKNPRISTQLSLLVGLVSAMLLGLGLLGLHGMSRSNDALKTVYEDRAMPIDQLARMDALQRDTRLALAQALMQTLPAADAVAQIEGHIAQAGKLWEAYLSAQPTAQEARLATAAADALASFVQDGLLPSVAALRAKDPKEVMRLQTQKVQPLSVALQRSLDALIRLQLDEAHTQYAAAMAHAATLRGVSIAAIGLGVLLAAAFGYAMARAIGRQLGAEPAQAAALAQRVAAGELDTPIALRDGDRSSLMAQLKLMQSSLGDVVGRVRQNADSVATAIGADRPGQQRPERSAPSSRPARWSRPPRRWKSSAPPSGRTPTTRARPTSWRWAPRPWRSRAARWSARWSTR